MLQHAVELEMSAFLGRDYYRNAPAVTAERGRRNGYEKHTVLTGEGPIEVEVPRVRTTNLLERLFGENRRRVKVIPHFFAERAGMKLVYATMLAASRRWHGVQMNPSINRAIDQLF